MTMGLYAALGFLCIAVILSVAVRSALIGSDRSEKKRLFTTTAFCVAVACFAELLCNLFDASGVTVARHAAYAIDFIYFMMIACSSCCWFFYVFVIRDTDFMYSRRRGFLCVLPFTALVVLLAVSCFTDGGIFYIDAAGVYHRGPLYFLHPILSYWYVAAAAVHALTTTLQKRFAVHRRESLTLFLCTVLTVVCGGAQYVMPSLPLFSVGATLALLAVFLDSLTPMISLDPLTGIHNRRDLLVHLADEAKYLRHGERLHFLFLDVDSFKQINDSYGHAEGDRILRQIASELKAFCHHRKCYCARYGGDELAVVLVLRQEEDISETCDALTDAINSLHLRVFDSPEVQVSVGRAEYGGHSPALPVNQKRGDAGS